MRRRLLIAFMAIVVLILVVQDGPLISYLSRVERDRLATALERDAFILAGHAKESLDVSTANPLPSLEPYVVEYSKASDSLVVVTDALGLAVVSNDLNVVIGSSYANRPEISQALTGLPSTGQRFSKTLNQTLLYVAVPVLSGDKVIGVVRLSHPRSVVDDKVRRQISGILLVGFISLVVAAAAAVVLSSTVTRPLRNLRRTADALSHGDLSSRAIDNEGPPEVRDLARAFNVMVGRLSSNLDHQRAFAGEVSHQLRTPLTALRLRLETAQAAVDASDGVVVEALEASRRETERMQTMVEQLLALSRLEAGTIAAVEVDASAVARDRVAMWGPLAEEHGVRVVADAGGQIPCRAIDGAVEQIIDNFIDNALSVAPRGSTIEVEVSSSAGTVFIDVIDDGPGLSAVDRTDAFQRFWRGNQSSSMDGGSGLGLAVVRQLAVASGGSAELLSARPDGHGIRARVRLPSS